MRHGLSTWWNFALGNGEVCTKGVAEWIILTLGLEVWYIFSGDV